MIIRFTKREILARVLIGMCATAAAHRLQNSGEDILRTERFCEFVPAATSPNRLSSSPLSIGNGASPLRSIYVCLAVSKFTKPFCARYKKKSGGSRRTRPLILGTTSVVA